ncbi:aKG-HExxH-type peptide beta-hydroxylase [Streptomyces chryseus]|uniref:HEXXH motif domain-containing protein n=1 Tax=Streptomyces chryseus TaxID=68186 RepID=A0ABQ3E3Q4_9ACTN|nr:HEXXH motif-containing putative peptide modification protein [Streptomyces chryseus]GHB22735.1 HEXXH motif domain-containing protein [Streptomyces chryseus]
MTRAPVPAALVDRLARTRPDAAATTALRAGLHARRLLLFKSLLARLDRQAAAAAPAARARFARHWQLLEHAERRDPAPVREVLDYPLTGAWLAGALTAPEGPALDRHLAYFGSIAATAALRAGCDLRITLDAPAGLLSLPGLGNLRCPAHRAELHARGHVVRITGGGPAGALLLRSTTGRGRPTGGGPGWSALRVLAGGTAVLDDLHPYRVPPHGMGAAAMHAADRTTVAREPWPCLWRRALALIDGTDPGRAAEIRAMQRVLVPLVPVTTTAYDRRHPMSATLRAAPGGVLTSLPAGPRELAEVLVHETHHTKMAALHERVPLYRPGGDGLHRVGWRPDPRPVVGVLQGAYAHLALMDLWRRAATGPASPDAWRRRAGEQFAQHREQVAEALSILQESDELTNEGRQFTGGMQEHYASLGAAPPAFE